MISRPLAAPRGRSLLALCSPRWALVGALAGLLPLLACPTPPKPQSECDQDADCRGGDICVGPDDDVRVCTAPCGADRPCQEGYACIAEDGRPGCFRIEGTLQTGEACDEDTQCASGACVGEKEAKHCVELCAEDLSCPDDQGCFLVGPRKVCLTPLDDRTAGEACETPRQCGSGRCVAVEHVGTGGFCVDACGEGGACASEGHACVTLDIGAQVCVPAAEDGTPCHTPEICQNGRCVTDVDGEAICTGVCGEGDTCAEGWTCVHDDEGTPICMPRLDDRQAGEPCESARECASGTCASFQGHGALCAEPCGPDNTCPDGELCWETDSGTGLCGPPPP